MTTHYQSTQFGTHVVLGLLVASVAVGIIAKQTGWLWIYGLVFAVMAIGIALFHSLTIRVTERRVECWFGPGLIRKRFDLAEITEARPVRNRWYYGWGIRLTPHGWMFNVAGLDAVEITLTSGKRFRIGTHHPDEAARAIESARMSFAGPGG